jgi:hypothetical protein
VFYCIFDDKFLGLGPTQPQPNQIIQKPNPTPTQPNYSKTQPQPNPTKLFKTQPQPNPTNPQGWVPALQIFEIFSQKPSISGNPGLERLLGIQHIKFVLQISPSITGLQNIFNFFVATI